MFIFLYLLFDCLYRKFFIRLLQNTYGKNEIIINKLLKIKNIIGDDKFILFYIF